MAEVKHLLVLANSARDGRHCVAGKLAVPRPDGNFDVAPRWIRLSDPSTEEGAVPYLNTICPGHGPVRPLDVVKVPLKESCNNPDHPEDCFFDPTLKWEYVASVSIDALAQVADNPKALWNQGSEAKSVPAGYVRQMGDGGATLYLIKAPANWKFTFWKEVNPFAQNEKTIRRLEFTYAGRYHEFSVTDTDFTRRHGIFNRMKLYEQQMLTVPNPANAYFCLSLTRLTSPNFDRKHYKICATIFEP